MAESRFVLVFDGQCGPCSRIGQMLQDVKGLTVVGDTSAEFTRYAENNASGRSIQSPSLLEVSGDTVVVVLRGWSMRLRLARILGFRRARRWLELLQAESDASRDRPGGGVSRRHLLLGGAAGLVASALGARPAAAQGLSASAVGTSELAALRAVGLAKSAAGRWGTPSSGFKVVVEGVTYWALTHPHGVTTMFDSARSVAVTVRQNPSDPMAVEFFDVTGEKLAEIASNGSRFAAAPPPVRAERVGHAFARCVGQCIGYDVTTGCLEACLAAPAGPACLWCAGSKGVKCVIKCWHLR